MNGSKIGVGRIGLLLGAGLLATFALWALGTGASAAEESRSRTPQASFTDDGVDGCLRCHAGDSMTVIGETAHGASDDPHAPFARHGCESCHGPGSLHVSRARGGAGFPPLARFGRGGDPVEDQLGACLGCHEQAMGELRPMEWRGSLHDTGRMNCSTCHQIHTASNVLAEPEQQKANCSRCHKSQIENHNRFEGKGILFDRLTCHDCHDAHQLIGRQ